tara:strand:+ start:962 stop:2167 length:1206 start_codon:yes stop_codon:yes gene_type:complete
MPWESEYDYRANNVTYIYAIEDGKESTKKLVFKINENELEVLFFPRDDFFVRKVVLKGFGRLPDEFVDSGYIKGGVQYYLNKKFSRKNVKAFIIDKDQPSSFRAYNGGFKVVLNYDEFKILKEQFTAIVNESKRDKSEYADEFFYKNYPRIFNATSTSSQTRLKKVIKNLDESIIPHLSPDDVSRVEKFYESLIEKKYKSLSSKFKLITRTKLKIDKIAIQELIDEFEKKLKSESSESDWGKFLKKYLFLLDSKYVDSIPELNVVLAGSRNVDFGLIDNYNYLDIFEIKKPNTKLLESKTDRGNYFWHKETNKAITQAEKYLFNAERKGNHLSEDIQREIGKTVNIIKPRAILLIGHSEQLDNLNKKTDFRILRNSLKNVEVILYDELLERLKNQRNKVFE